MPTRLLFGILLALLSRAACAAGNPNAPLLMTFWSDDTIRQQLAALVTSLRAALGPPAFLSVEVPAD